MKRSLRMQICGRSVHLINLQVSRLDGWWGGGLLCDGRHISRLIAAIGRYSRIAKRVSFVRKGRLQSLPIAIMGGDGRPSWVSGLHLGMAVI